MSFDIFVVCLRGGKPEPITREIFDSIFASHDTHPHLRAKDPDYMVVEYPDGSGGSIYCGGNNDEERSCIMFNHWGGKSFNQDMYRLAHLTRLIIFWPTNNPIYLYTDPSVPEELKGVSYFEEARGIFIRSGAEIDEAIASN